MPILDSDSSKFVLRELSRVSDIALDLFSDGKIDSEDLQGLNVSSRIMQYLENSVPTENWRTIDVMGLLLTLSAKLEAMENTAELNILTKTIEVLTAGSYKHLDTE